MVDFRTLSRLNFLSRTIGDGAAGAPGAIVLSHNDVSEGIFIVLLVLGTAATGKADSTVAGCCWALVSIICNKGYNSGNEEILMPLCN